MAVAKVIQLRLGLLRSKDAPVKLFLLWDEVALFAIQKLSNIGPGIEKKKIIDDSL